MRGKASLRIATQIPECSSGFDWLGVACLGQHGVDGGDDKSLRNAHEHAGGRDCSGILCGSRRQQAGCGPQQEGQRQHYAAAVALRQEAPGHLPGQAIAQAPKQAQ